MRLLTRLGGVLALAGTLAACAGPGFVYVVAYPSREILAFAIAGKDGALKPVAGSPFPAGPGPFDVGVSPSGRLLYVGHQGDRGRNGSIGVYAVDARSGRLTATPPLAIPNGSIRHFAVDPLGRFVYAYGQVGLEPALFGFRVDEADARLTPIGDEPALMRVAPSNAVVGIHPSGRFFYLGAGNAIHVYEIAASGRLTEVGAAPVAGQATLSSLVVAPSGRFLYAGTGPPRSGESGGGLVAYAVGDTTGALTPIPGRSPTGVRGAPLWLAIAPSGRFVYAATTTAMTITVHAVDAATGALAPAPVAQAFSGDHPRAFPRTLAVHGSGRLLYATALSSMLETAEGWVLVYGIDETRGALTATPHSLYLSGKKTGGVAVVGKPR